jgi:hypothetical protein
VTRALLIAAIALAGCKPQLYALSTPPPGRSGWLDSKERTLEVTAGVAIAFACEHDGGPCKHARATSDDPAIADVVPAHLARLDARVDPGFTPTTSMVPATSFVVVAHAPGTTVVHVRSDDGDRDLTVTVLPEPAPAVVTARAEAPPPAPRTP